VLWTESYGDNPVMITLSPEQELEQQAKRGRAIYDERIKPLVEPEYDGQIVAIHLDSGDYEVARNSPTARFALRKRHMDGVIMTTDVVPAKIDSLTVRMLASQLLSRENK
jgi:hypothetical protein